MSESPRPLESDDILFLQSTARGNWRTLLRKKTWRRWWRYSRTDFEGRYLFFIKQMKKQNYSGFCDFVIRFAP